MKNKSLEEKFEAWLEVLSGNTENLDFDSFKKGFELAQKESEEKIKKLREALEYYAESANWIHEEFNGRDNNQCSIRDEDVELCSGGKLARKVLKEIE